jgi:enamine deaminase RidA (YjgF/YER057c/UK114 family)
VRILQPPGWKRPRGYSNGMLGEGRIVAVAGMIGWDEQGRFADGLVPQVRQALLNVVAVLREAGGGPETVARMTWYVTDMSAYRGAGPALGPVWRETMGRHYPAMAVVGVTALVEALACVEIEALAILP